MKYLLLACLCLATSCSPSSPDALVAEVGPYQISARLLRLYVEELLDGLRPKKTGDEARNYLQALIDRRLLLMEASDRGLDATNAFSESVQEKVDARVRAIYRAREITSQVKIKEAAVRRYYEEEGYGRERLTNAIKVSSRAAIDTVLQELEGGLSFEEVARARSLDERSANRGGELGFVGRDLLETLHIPPKVFNDLPQGQISKPLAASEAWHIVRFGEERPTSYEKYRAGITSLLYNKRQAEVEAEHYELLRESLQVRLQMDGLRELVAAYRKKQPTLLAESSTVLYTYESGEVTVGQAQEALRLLNVSYGFADSAQAIASLDYYFFQGHLLREAARKAGLYETPEIQQFAVRTAEYVLLESMRRSVVAELIDLSEGEVRTYYDTHLETFRHDESTWLEEVLLSSRDEALKIKTKIEAGAPFVQFVDRSVREDARKYKGEYHFHRLAKARYPVLVPAIFEATPGQLKGPLEVEGGYSVFRVLREEKSGIEDFETSQRRARALLLMEREGEVLGVVLAELREKFAAQIKIYPDNLKTALPDSLLAALK